MLQPSFVEGSFLPFLLLSFTAILAQRRLLWH